MLRNLFYFILIAISFVFVSCSETATDAAEENHEQPALSRQEEALKRAESAIRKEREAKPVQFQKPRLGEVASFFRQYGEAHPETKVRLKTRLGDIDLLLYKETPLHRANFIYNIKNELYYRTIFYRVVPEFMIQGGNSDNDRTLEKREHAGSYYIPNECKPGLIHKRGALAMAMMYEDNPDLKSSQYSFYLVIGKSVSEAEMDAVEEEYKIQIPESDRKVYRAIGGTPHLDGKHTVFGEVIRGMEVIERIAAEKRDTGDWPVTDVIIDYEILE